MVTGKASSHSRAEEYTRETHTIKPQEVHAYILQDIVKIQPRKACRYPNLRSFGWDSYDRLAFYIRESSEVDRRHVPPISEAIPGSGGNE